MSPKGEWGGDGADGGEREIRVEKMFNVMERRDSQRDSEREGKRERGGG